MRRAGIAQASVLVTALVMSLAGSAAAAPNPGAAPGPTSAATRLAGAATYHLTLVTGDVATLTVLPDGRRSAALAPRRGATPPYHLSEERGDLFLIPAEAYPYVTSGQLDRRLFNLTGLVTQGYHDGAEPLRLLLAGPTTGPRAHAVPATPQAARRALTLPSVGAVAVTPRPGKARALWEAIDDDNPRDGLRLAGGVGAVWLDGRVRATLEDSVPQIGATDAWRSGYDGEGVAVAVLDSGYDPEHPDLAESVTAAKSFVPDESVVDGNGHGTHVAATVAGSGAASGGARKGVAPGADLIVGKVLDRTGGGAESWVLAGMEWAVAQGAEVVNMSLGGGWFPTDGSDPMSQAVDRLSAESGALFVIAAGNNGGIGMPWITSPGSATSALTVGAVDSDDRLADFSSRGPRYRDGAIKPEVTAPGVGIVAARAANTSLGGVVGEHHTTMSGTSMATPHVAGAAAILAQRHPKWTGERIKAALAATADPTAGTPITAQGAGRIDLATALAQAVTVDTATLNLGEVSWTDQPPAPVVRKLTYRNDTDRPVRLRLSHDVQTPGGVRAALSISPSTAQIAPGRSVTVTVSLDSAATEAGGYSGVVRATGSGVTLRTPVGFELRGKLRKLTVTGIDRNGTGELEDFMSAVEVWDLASGERHGRYFDNTGEATLFLPTGRYAVMAYLFTKDAQYYPDSVTLMGRPEIAITEATRLTFDARAAVPVTVETPRRAEATGYGYFWRRAVDGRSTMSGWSLGPAMTQDVYVQRFGPARSGGFQVGHRWDMELPQLTIDVTGPDGFRLPTPRGGEEGARYVGEAELRLVDAGDGAPSELADARARGAVALVRWRGWEHTETQLRDAAEAGVTLLLLHQEQAGFWEAPVGQSPVPVYSLERPEADRLLGLLRERDALTVKVTGVAASPYRYDLMFTEDRIAGPVRRTVGGRSLAAIETAYHHHEGAPRLREYRSAYLPGVVTGFTLSHPAPSPARRTNYVNVRAGLGALEWGEASYSFLDPYYPVTEDYAAPRTYRPGEQVRRAWSTAIARPAIPDIAGSENTGLPVARFENAIRAAIPPYVSGTGDVYGWVDRHDTGPDYERVELVLRRDGEPVGRTTSSVGQFPVPAAESDYQLDLTVERGPDVWATTSTKTRTVWSFRSGEVSGRAVLPLPQAAYRLSTDLENRVSAEAPGQLVVTPGYQPGARGPGGFEVTVEVSYDDGTTWRTADAKRSGGDVVAALPAAGEGARHASIRVTLTDSAGNRVRQTVVRAWHVA